MNIGKDVADLSALVPCQRGECLFTLQGGKNVRNVVLVPCQRGECLFPKKGVILNENVNGVLVPYQRGECLF